MTKVVLVTGGAKRLGRAMVEKFAANQWNVVIHYRSAALEAKTLISQLPSGHAISVAADFSEPDACADLIAKSLARFGRLDCVIASAANFEEYRFEDIDNTAVDRAIDINLKAPFRLMHAAHAALKESSGSGIFLTGIGAERPYRHHAPYLVAKAGIRHATQVLALEMSPEVRVNAISPGVVLAPETYTSERLQHLQKSIPLQRFGAPDDIAEAAWFLANANYITGNEIVVDGGRRLAIAD